MGEATIYLAYGEDFSTCPQRPPEFFSAVIHSGPVVLGLNLPPCYTCFENAASPEILEAVARDLHLRPQRDLSRG